MKLTGHAEVFGLLGLVTTLGAGWSFAFLLFEDLTLGVIITVTGLKEHSGNVSGAHVILTYSANIKVKSNYHSGSF